MQTLTSEAMDELSIEIRNRLLAPTAWHEALSEYAKATRLAVALVDSEGQLIGELFNPQPLWVLLMKSARPAGPCPFSVSAPSSFCKCVSDTLTGGKPVIAKDPSGLVHFSVPLILNRRRVGAVVAGQAFDQHPETLQLEKLAKRLYLDPSKVWQLARASAPIRAVTLQVYANLLATFSDALIRRVYSSVIDAGRLVKTQGQMQRAKVAVESTKEELRDLAARLLTIQDEERRRISREIHDDLVQRLALVTIKIVSILKVMPATCTASARIAATLSCSM